MKKKGIILELRTKEAVVINDLCEYEKIKRVEGMFEGQMVEYSTTRQTKVFRNVAAISSVAAILVLCIVGYLYFFLNMNPQVYAYVDLDINPSMEFLIDKNNSVIDLKPLNSDADGVISTFEVKKKNINDAISYILERLSEKGYISSDNENLILLAASYSEDSKIAENTIEKTINAIKGTIEKVDNKKISVKVIYVKPDLRKKSIDNNMSMGRYVLYKNAQKAGADITPYDAKSAKVKDLIPYYRIEDSLPPVQNVGNVDSDMPNIRDTQSDSVRRVKEKATLKSKLYSILDDIKLPAGSSSTEDVNEDKSLSSFSPNKPQGGHGIPSINNFKPGIADKGIPPIFGDPKKSQEGTEIPPVFEDTKKPQEGTRIPPVFDDTKKPQEGTGIPPVFDDTKKPQEGTRIPPIFDDNKKPQEGTGMPPIPVEPKKPPEGPGIPPVPNEPIKPPEGSGIPPVSVEPKRPPEGSGIPPVPDEPRRPPEGSGIPPVLDEPRRPPERPGIPPVLDEPRKPQEGYHH